MSEERIKKREEKHKQGVNYEEEKSKTDYCCRCSGSR
jgi:hypothetical protein